MTFKQKIKSDFTQLIFELESGSTIIPYSILSGSKYKRAILMTEIDLYNEQSLIDRTYGLIDLNKRQEQKEIYLKLIKAIDSFIILKEE